MSLAHATPKLSLPLRQRLEKHIDELPVLPTVVAKLMALDRKDPKYFERVQALVETEPSFCARILAFANSAASAPRQPITTLGSAIMRIGSHSASNLVLAMSVTRVFVPRDDWERGLWRHALEVALAARTLAAGESDLVPDEVYAAALLHDVGRFVMLQEAPDDLRRLDESAWGTPEELVAQERRFFGTTHTELGELACRRWRLPDVIAQVVRDHHATSISPSTRVGKTTAIVRLADIAMFSSSAPGTPNILDRDDGALARLYESKVSPLLDVSMERFGAILAQARSEAADAAHALGLA